MKKFTISPALRQKINQLVDTEQSAACSAEKPHTKKLKQFTLSQAAKKQISQLVGVEFDDLQNMDTEQQDQLAAARHGKKLGWNQSARVDGYPVGRSIAEVDAQLDTIQDRTL